MSKEKFDKLISELKQLVDNNTLCYNNSTCKFEIYKDDYDNNTSKLLIESDIYFPDFYTKE